MRPALLPSVPSGSKNNSQNFPAAAHITHNSQYSPMLHGGNFKISNTLQYCCFPPTLQSILSNTLHYSPTLSKFSNSLHCFPTTSTTITPPLLSHSLSLLPSFPSFLPPTAPIAPAGEEAPRLRILKIRSQRVRLCSEERHLRPRLQATLERRHRVAGS